MESFDLDRCPTCGTVEPDTLCLDPVTLQVTHCDHCHVAAPPLRHKEAVAAFERRYFSDLLMQHRRRKDAAKHAGMTTEGLRVALRRLRLASRDDAR